jgi:HTH-type transcriptional regulator/antitoxin MqsA
MENMIHPETGEILHRGVRPIEYTYKGEKIIVEMPGWYPADNDDGIFSQEDMKFSDAALKHLKSVIEEKTA